MRPLRPSQARHPRAGLARQRPLALLVQPLPERVFAVLIAERRQAVALRLLVPVLEPMAPSVRRVPAWLVVQAPRTKCPAESAPERVSAPAQPPLCRARKA